MLSHLLLVGFCVEYTEVGNNDVPSSPYVQEVFTCFQVPGTEPVLPV